MLNLETALRPDKPVVTLCCSAVLWMGLVDPVVLSVQRPLGQELWSAFSNFMMDLGLYEAFVSLKVCPEPVSK